jgi:hypothetical protein
MITPEALAPVFFDLNRFVTARENSPTVIC